MHRCIHKSHFFCLQPFAEIIVLTIRRASLLSLFSLAASSQAASITCSEPTTEGLLYYSAATTLKYIGQIGVLETRGNAELLAKYPSTSVIAHNASIIPCVSTYLNASIPSTSASSTPVKLQLVDDPTNCLGLESNGAANVFLIKQACEYGDDDSQDQQFWTQDTAEGYLLPQWTPDVSDRWNVQFNEGDTEEVIANPATCFEGQTCQDGTRYSFSVKSA